VREIEAPLARAAFRDSSGKLALVGRAEEVGFPLAVDYAMCFQVQGFSFFVDPRGLRPARGQITKGLRRGFLRRKEERKDGRPSYWRLRRRRLLAAATTLHAQ
jgi:hypothetical protein